MLWTFWSLTKSSKLDTIEGNKIFKIYNLHKNNKYPKNPENFLKVAVFGGSSTAGNYIEFNFSNVVSQDLKEIIGSNIFVKNYGGLGESFYKEQAEILKKTIPYYDIFIIYSGNNEWVNLYNENCGIKTFNVIIESCENLEIDRKKRISLVTEELYKKKIHKFNLFKFLESKSRIYAILFKVNYYISKIFTKNIEEEKDDSFFKETGLVRPKISELNKAFSDKKIDQIPQKFESDLKKIIKNIKKEKKFLILVGVSGNEFWPPFFSKLSKNLSNSEVNFLNAKFTSIEKNIKTKNFLQAQKETEEILFKEPDHAYANFLMGKISIKLDKIEASWNYLEKAIDEDGFPIRSLSKINHLLKKQSALNDKNVSYVDFPKVIRKITVNNPSNPALFEDWVHPKVLSHIIIGRLSSCEIIKHIKLETAKTKYFCDKSVEYKNLETIYGYYKKKFKISEKNIIEARKKIYRWIILVSRISAHPEHFYKIAERNLIYQYPNYKNGQDDTVKYLILSSFFKTAQGINCNDVKENIYKAFSISPDIFYQTLDNPFSFPEKHINIKSIFNLSGVKVKNLDPKKNSGQICNNLD